MVARKMEMVELTRLKLVVWRRNKGGVKQKVEQTPSAGAISSTAKCIAVCRKTS